MKRNIPVLVMLAATCLFAISCVPTRRLKAAQADAQTLRDDSARFAAQIASQESTIGQLKQQIGDLNKKVEDLTSQAGNQQNQLNLTKEQLADRQRRIMELIGTTQPEHLVHDLRNILNERELLRTLAEGKY